MKRIAGILLALIWLWSAVATAAEPEPAGIEMPVYESGYPAAMDSLIASADRDGLAALFVLDARDHLADFDPAEIQGVYWLENSDTATLLVFFADGFWNIGLQEGIYSAYATDMEAVADLDGLIDYLRTEKGRDYQAADVEAGFARLADMGIEIEPEAAEAGAEHA